MGSLYDFHIHTTYLKCANETMSVPALVRRCEELGLQTIAVTDHLDRAESLPLHQQIKADLADLESPLEIYFGAEVNVLDKDTGAIFLTPELVEQYGFEVVIGGVHTSYHQEPDPRGIIDLQQKLMLQVIANPLIDVLVHPWWFGGGEFRAGGPMEWFTTMDDIPDDYARELGEAAVAHNTAIEANGAAIWVNPQYSDEFTAQYADYMAVIAATGAKISISSDAHDIKHLDSVHVVADALAARGVTGDQLWRPAPR